MLSMESYTSILTLQMATQHYFINKDVPYNPWMSGVQWAAHHRALCNRSDNGREHHPSQHLLVLVYYVYGSHLFRYFGDQARRDSIGLILKGCEGVERLCSLVAALTRFILLRCGDRRLGPE